jgi:hypothetical protein
VFLNLKSNAPSVRHFVAPGYARSRFVELRDWSGSGPGGPGPLNRCLYSLDIDKKMKVVARGD